MSENEQVIYKKALKKFGWNSQFIVALEELAELQVEIAKHLTRKRDVKNIEDYERIIDELADVEIVTDQLKYILLCETKVKERKVLKLKKLEGYLNA